MKKQHISFPSIGQFREIIKAVHSSAKYHEVPVPKIKFTGATKLHGCFSKDTMVTLATGEQKPISDIVVGDYVLTYDTNIQEQCVSPVTNVWLGTDLQKNWVRLVFDDRKIECTEDHLFWTQRGWVEAKNLLSSDTFEVDS